MQLVGGTRSLIAAPFMLEGTIHGLIGSAIACCLLVPAHMYLHDLSARAAPFFQLMPDRALVGFAFGLLLTGALLGLTGSTISIRRFLGRRPGWQT
jgi:cell division protein FtsX